MMTLKTDIRDDLSVFFNADEFSELVTYTPKGRIGVSILAIVYRGNPFQEPYVRGEDTATCEVEVKAGDVSSPQYGDTFNFGGDVWEFDPTRGIIRTDEYTHLIGLIRSDQL
jgi:hypothetical protein